MRFRDQVVLVTGAASGIGQEIAHRFAAEGAHMIIADHNESQAQRTAAQIPNARPHPVDVTDRSAVRAMTASYDRIDVLINNAGGATDADFDDLTEDQWNQDIDLCLKGTFLCTQAALPTMRRQGAGAIVNIASVNALAHFGNEAYSAAKAGVLSLTRSVAARYGPYGIRCNAVAPGTIRTPSWDARIRRTPDVLEKVARWYPLRRVGTPADVAPAVLFLASAEAAWITGATLQVDGGLLTGHPQLTTDILNP